MPAAAIRSSAGVGMIPPKVPETPKPASSVMIRSTLGARLGGTTVGGHQGVDVVASSVILPPKAGGGGGNCLPTIVVVALGAPRTPLTCWAWETLANPKTKAIALVAKTPLFIVFAPPLIALDAIRNNNWQGLVATAED